MLRSFRSSQVEDALQFLELQTFRPSHSGPSLIATRRCFASSPAPAALRAPLASPESVNAKSTCSVLKLLSCGQSLFGNRRFLQGLRSAPRLRTKPQAPAPCRLPGARMEEIRQVACQGGEPFRFAIRMAVEVGGIGAFHSIAPWRTGARVQSPMYSIPQRMARIRTTAGTTTAQGWRLRSSGIVLLGNSPFCRTVASRRG
jgi:hypothetical protein